MTDREKLISLLEKINSTAYIKIPTESGFSMSKYGEEYIADYLIAHGVMVREPQKPLTAEEAKDFMLWAKNRPPLLWIEYKTNKEKNRYMYIETVNELYQFLQILSSYGNNVRCWIEKPTDEEMETAEWE